MAIHQIRLAGPWELRIQPATAVAQVDEGVGTEVDAISGKRSIRDQDSIATCLRVTLPYQVPIPTDPTALPQTAILSRSFHCPTGLGLQTRVRILLRISFSDPAVALNKKPLKCRVSHESDQICLLSAEIREDLLSFNTIAVQIPLEPNETKNRWIHSAAIEIDESPRAAETSGL